MYVIFMRQQSLVDDLHGRGVARFQPDRTKVFTALCHMYFLQTISRVGASRSRPGQPSRPADKRADRSVLNMSIVMVIGPTPPGTGVTAPATVQTSS